MLAGGKADGRAIGAHVRISSIYAAAPLFTISMCWLVLSYFKPMFRKLRDFLTGSLDGFTRLYRTLVYIPPFELRGICIGIKRMCEVDSTTTLQPVSDLSVMTTLLSYLIFILLFHGFLQNRKGVRPCPRPLTPFLFSLRANLATASLQEVGQELAYRISPGSRK
jgi:hypothetical protein